MSGPAHQVFGARACIPWRVLLQVSTKPDLPRGAVRRACPWTQVRFCHLQPSSTLLLTTRLVHTCTDEGGWEGMHWLCCTWEGLDRLKRGIALCTGAAVLTASVLTLLNPADTTFKPVSFVRSCWNALFGLLMILVQCRGSRWSATRASPPSRPTNWIKRRFGFMSGWFGRALFFLFVGTNIVEPDSPSAATAMLTIVTGVACLFVGAVELLFGFRCAERGDGNEGPTGSGNNAASEPSPNTNAPGHQSSFARVFGGGTVRSSFGAAPPHIPPHPTTLATLQG